MAGHDIIVIGGSAGGLEAMNAIVGGLPADLPAAVFVVLHTSPHSPGLLPEILNHRGPLPAAHARDGEPVTPGRIYVAPPDHHLLLEAGRVRVTRGPKENRFRPAVDPLFRSAALAYGPRVVGVVLSGWLDDGAAGLWAVKVRGGVAVVQDPDEAFARSMPESAMRQTRVDYRLRVADIAPTLAQVGVRTRRRRGGVPRARGARNRDEDRHGGQGPAIGRRGHRRAVAVRLPGVPRHPDAAEGRRRGPVPLPHRAFLHGRRPPGGDDRVGRGDAVERRPLGPGELAADGAHRGPRAGGRTSRPCRRCTTGKAAEARERAELVRRAVMGHETLSGESSAEHMIRGMRAPASHGPAADPGPLSPGRTRRIAYNGPGSFVAGDSAPDPGPIRSDPTDRRQEPAPTTDRRGSLGGTPLHEAGENGSTGC